MTRIPMWRVLEAFSAAVKRRDKVCMVRDYTPCAGPLECSHLFARGGNPSIALHPDNARAQCHAHHRRHHEGREPFYREWLAGRDPDALARLERLRGRTLRYSEALKAEIIRLCNADRLRELKTLIEKELEK